MRWLKGTRYEILYSHCACNLIEFIDADYEGDLHQRRSTTGYVFTLDEGAISWQSMLQRTFALSTTEVECLAAVEFLKEAIWLNDFVEELGIAHDKVGFIATIKVQFSWQRIRCFILELCILICDITNYERSSMRGWFVL